MRKSEPGLYLTLFLDLLGWGDMVTRFDSVHSESVLDEKMVKSLAQPILQHYHTRQLIEWFLQSKEQTYKFVYDDEQVSSAEKKEISAIAKACAITQKPIYESFSDCFVISREAEYTGPYRPFRILAATSSLLLDSAVIFGLLLSTGIVVRGGIEVGMGAAFRSNIVSGKKRQLVGASVIKAYQTERRAGHPRVLVGNDLLQLLVELRKPSANPKLDDLKSKLFFPSIDSLLHKEADGSVSVDFLNPKLIPIWQKIADSDSLSRMRAVLRQQLAAARESKNELLVGRYETLTKYVSKRLRGIPTNPVGDFDWLALLQS